MKQIRKTTLAYNLAALIIFSSALGGCEPLSDHEKEMRRIEKEIKKSKKIIKRYKRQFPDSIKPDSEYDKKALEYALTRSDWKMAKMYYQLLLDDNINLGDYPASLETRMLDLVKPLPGSLYEFNYRGYDFLAIIAPDNQTYKSKAALYKNKIVARGRASIAKLRTNTDKIEGITWYHHPYDLSARKEAGVEFYIGRKGQGQPWLRMKAEYVSQFGWMFAESVTAWHDGIKETLISGNFERKSSSIVQEWLDVTPTELQIEIMRSMAEADEAILRFNGSRRHPQHPDPGRRYGDRLARQV